MARSPRRQFSRQSTRCRPAPLDSASRPKLTTEDVELLSRKMRETYGWDADPKPFQLAGVQAQIEGVDMIIQASTGAGKTAIAAGPHLWPSSAGKTTIMVCPLLSLEDEMVRTFDLDFGLKAIAVNSKNGACSPLVIKRILAGTYHIVLISPEMLQSRTFINRVLRNRNFARRILSLIIDEAHCISHWGADFRKKYSSLGIIRAFLARGTPVIALSATFTPRVRRDVMSKLHFPKGSQSFLNVGNERPNVALVVRACEHALNTYADLDFVIPEGAHSRECIPKTYIYADNISVGSEIVDHLKGLVIARTGMSVEDASESVRPFNAVMSDTYRTESMDAFRRGTVRILVCTDAAGMGCNVRDVDMVVQWKLPSTLSSFIQRAGRAARDPTRMGLAVLLVERSAFSPPDAKCTAPSALPSRAISLSTTPSPVTPAQLPNPSQPGNAKTYYAEAHGVKRGSHAGTKDGPPSGEQPLLDPDAADEGLLAFVQSVRCRREVWSSVYESTTQKSSAACCDLCNPGLLDRTRPGASPRLRRAKKPKRGNPALEYQPRLYAWCRTVFERDHCGAQWDYSGILSHDQVEHLTSVGPVDKAKLASILESSWVWWEEYADELLIYMQDWPIPFVPTRSARARKSGKRQRDLDADTTSDRAQSKHKRPRSGSSSPQHSQPLQWEPSATPRTFDIEALDIESPGYHSFHWESPLTAASYTDNPAPPVRSESVSVPAEHRQGYNALS
ncbi:P-loop containing nucleoside triphosphate hydrolase protein [Trametes cingulata]|nr:P-loop containing nucleoside triphosphate hydrolase protein [Trametes cingulata]KAI0349404.1 P-loop containing nucleoside triphosphate hydrolase protein [Trametes cingulata]